MGPRNRLQLWGGGGSTFLIVSIPVAAAVDFMLSRIGQIAPLLLLVDRFVPIRDTIKSTAAATEIEKIKNA